MNEAQNSVTQAADKVQALEVTSEPYRLNFTKEHKGKLLSELPPSFLQWIIRKNLAATRPDLKKALASYDSPATSGVPTTPQQSKTLDIGTLSSSRASGPRTEHEPGDFILTFGKHRNCKISDPEIKGSYLEWVATNTTFDPGPVCRAAVQAYLSSVASMAGPEQEPQTSFKAENTSDCIKSLGPDHILDFGRHSGKRLRDIPASYLTWLIDNHALARELSTAIIALGITPAIPGPRKPDWRPPKIGSAPRQFRDWLTNEDLWISKSDARKYFGLRPNLLEGLPMFMSRAVSYQGKIAKYWLFHVWDLRRVMTTKAAADVALKGFLEKKEEAFDDICAGMGLGGGLY
jgi:uncharacterized protein (DUF3820 family)